MNIGDVKISNNVFLAPMAGITDLPFRLLCKEQGCGMVYTEMVSAKGLYYGSQRTYDLLTVHEDEHPADSLETNTAAPQVEPSPE